MTDKITTEKIKVEDLGMIIYQLEDSFNGMTEEELNNHIQDKINVLDYIYQTWHMQPIEVQNKIDIYELGDIINLLRALQIKI